jgi:Cys-tRNA(Pro)/Cys-tRNA(Cys) deacylase
MTKTNAARLLDSLGINYGLLEYEVDESDLSAISVATKLNLNIEQVFKTLVLKGDKSGYFVCIIPGGEELDLKKTALVSGNKSVAMIPVKDIQEITGYIRGGCSPLGMKRRYPAYIDEACILYDFIYISAGVRGLQIKITPADLIKSAACELAELVVFAKGQ